MKIALKSLRLPCMTLSFASLLKITIAQAAIEGGDSKAGKALQKEKSTYCHLSGSDCDTTTLPAKTQRQWARYHT